MAIRGAPSHSYGAFCCGLWLCSEPRQWDIGGVSVDTGLAQSAVVLVEANVWVLVCPSVCAVSWPPQGCGPEASSTGI